MADSHPQKMEPPRHACSALAMPGLQLMRKVGTGGAAQRFVDWLLDSRDEIKRFSRTHTAHSNLFPGK